MFQNDALDLDVAVKQRNGSAYDLTGATLYFQMRENPKSATALVSVSTGSGITHTSPAGGLAVVAIAAAATAGLTVPRTLVWALELEKSTRRRVIAEGKMTVRPEVTKT
jgi:hypothetical protein